MSSLRSYLPMAWAETIPSIASASARSDRPDAALATLSLFPIMMVSFVSLSQAGFHICDIGPFL